MDAKDDKRLSLTQRRSQVRVLFRPLPRRFTPLTENGGNNPFSTYLKVSELLDLPVERFLASVRFEHRSKLDQLGIDIEVLNVK